MIRTVLGFAIVAFAAGCSLDPRNYETDPVTVETAQGPVVCQLYTPRTVAWDRAIDRPASMSVADADQICLQEGQRLKDGG